MASFEVLEGGLLCGLSQRPRRTGSSERGRTGSSTNTEAENSAEVSPEASLLFPLQSFAGVFRRVALAGRRSLHVPHDVVHSAVNLHAQFYRADEFMIGESDLCPRPAVCDVVRPRPVYISTLRRVPHV